jgi:hypothetical protein
VNAPVFEELNISQEVQKTLSEGIACVEFIPFSVLDFMTSVAFAAAISFIVIHLTRENRNGSKSLQLLSGTDFITYWLANYIFDWLVFFFNIVSYMLVLWAVSLIRNDTSTESYIITATGSNFYYTFVFLLVNSLTWPVLAYLWSFLFKSDIVSFVVLLILLNLATFLDAIGVLMLFLNVAFKSSRLDYLAKTARSLFSILFPNVGIKRALYNLKVRRNPYCIAMVKVMMNYDWRSDTSAFSADDPGIGRYMLFNLGFFVVGCLLLLSIEFFGKLNFSIMTPSKKRLISSNANKIVS